MKILKQLSSDIDWGFWSTILAIFFGWMLNELSQWFKVKNEEKQIVKRVIFELLEINYILQKSDIEGFMSSAVERILNKIPDDLSKESLKLSLEVGMVKVLKEYVTKEAAGQLSNLSGHYSEAITQLSSIDPISAYKLRDKTEVMEMYGQVDNYFESMSIHLPEGQEILRDSPKIVKSRIEPQILKDTIGVIDSEIRGLSLKVGFRTWWRVKKSLKKMEKSRNEHIDNVLEKDLDEVFNSVIARAREADPTGTFA